MLADTAALFGRGRELAIAPAPGEAIAGPAKRRGRLWWTRPAPRVRDRIDVLQHRLHDLVGEIGIGNDPETQTGPRLILLLGKARLEECKVALNVLPHGLREPGSRDDHARLPWIQIRG